MESFMNRALAYLGLKDIDDDELYVDDYETRSTTGLPRTAHRLSRPTT